MLSFLKDILTARDGESYDVGRVLWAIGAVAFIALTAYAVYRGGAFDPLNWGTGYGAILGGGGAGIRLKAQTEPGQ